LLADAIEGHPSRLLDKLSPDRTGLSSPINWLKEQTVAARNYSERILPSRKIELGELSPGEGRVGTVAGRHMAVCKDVSGCEHRLDPKCSHMGGIVHWNEVEQTWDCPVHGGRFSPSGERIYGPPQSKLNQAEQA
jgi:Rieske Fe-S protein